MQVSMNELKAALKRCFEAAGYFVGNYEDAANMILWLEKHGLQGLSELERSLPYIQGDNQKELSTLIFQDSSSVILDAHNRSSLNNIAAAVDLAHTKSLDSGIATVTVRNCHNRMFVLKAITDCGRRGVSAVAYWKNGTKNMREHTASIKAGQQYPMYQESLSDLNDISADDRQNLIIICSARVDLTTSIKASANHKTLITISAEQIGKNKERNIDLGIEVSSELWQKINAIGDGVLVPQSEQSRQGAG